MQIDLDLLRYVSKTLRNSTPTFESVEDGQTILVFGIPDISVRFIKTDRVVFDYLIFKVTERMVFVGKDLRLCLLDEDYSPRPVEDDDFADAVQGYLRWRISILKRFGV